MKKFLVPISTSKVSDLEAPFADNDAIPKEYVDDAVADIINKGNTPLPANQPNSLTSRGVIDSRSGGILTNGTGLIGFATSTYQPTRSHLYNFQSVSSTHQLNSYPETDSNKLDGVGAGFTTKGSHNFIGTSSSNNLNEIMAVNPNLVYRGSGTVVCNQDSVDANQRLYVGNTFLDQNGLAITASHHQHYGVAKLAQDLTLGTDTWLYIYRDDAINPHSEWIIGNAGANAYALRRGLKFWDYHFTDQKVDSVGNNIPFSRLNTTGNPDKPAGFGYSRHMVYDLWDNVDGLWEEANDGSGVGNWNGHTNVWRHPIKTAHGTHTGYTYSPTSTSTVIPESTQVSHSWHGGTYKYCYCAGTLMSQPEKFMRYEGWVGGVDLSGKNRGYAFPPAAAGVNWMMLCNYATSPITAEQTHSALDMRVDTSCRTKEVFNGLLPEHSYMQIRKVEDNNINAVVVSTLITGARISYGNRPIT